MEWSTEKPADPIEIRMYPGADGDFTFYEDENDNYDYAKGQHATIQLHWDDAAKTLTFGARRVVFRGCWRSTPSMLWLSERAAQQESATARRRGVACSTKESGWR